MSEWISIKDSIPQSGQKVLIKIFDKNDNEIEVDAIFTLYDIDETTEAWGWNIGKRTDLTARPSHWKPYE